jgi:ABC-type multidrug transport system fused ATPase/permease subunit
MSDSIVTAITTIIGVLLGFLLAELSNGLRESRAGKRQAKITKEILRQEINLNLATIRVIKADFSKSTKKLNEYDEDDDSDDYFVARTEWLAPLFSVLRLSTKIYESQLPYLNMALSSDEATKVVSFYSKLESMTQSASLLGSTTKHSPVFGSLLMQIGQLIDDIELSSNPLERS